MEEEDEEEMGRSDLRHLSVEARRKLDGRSSSSTGGDHYSLTFALLLYVNVFYSGLYGVVEFLFLLFKCHQLSASLKHSYDVATLAYELCMLTFFGVVEWLRLNLGQDLQLADFDKSLFSVFRILVLTVPSMYTVVYFTFWQNFVSRLDVLLGGIMLVIQAGQLLAAFLEMWNAFWRKRRRRQD